MHRYVFIAKYMLFSIACYRGPDKQSTHLKYMVQGPAITIMDIYLFFHHNGVTFLCERLWVGARAFLSLSLSFFLLLMDGFGHLGGWVLVIEGDSKCIFPLFHTKEQVEIWSYFSQKAVKINYLGWFCQIVSDSELRPWCLSLQWKTCPWEKHSEDDDDINNFWGIY